MKHDIRKIVSELKSLKGTNADEWMYIGLGNKPLCTFKEFLKEFCDKVGIEDID